MTPDPEAIRDLWEVDLEQEDLPGRARRGRRRPPGAAATRGLHPRSSTRRRRRSGSGPTCPSATRRCSRPGSARSRPRRRWTTTCWRPGAAGSRTRTSSSVWVTCCIRRRSRRRVSALRSYPGRRSRRPSPPPPAVQCPAVRLDRRDNAPLEEPLHRRRVGHRQQDRQRKRGRYAALVGPGADRGRGHDRAPRRRVRDSLGCRASARLCSSRLGSSSWDGLRLSDRLHRGPSRRRPFWAYRSRCRTRFAACGLSSDRGRCSRAARSGWPSCWRSRSKQSGDSHERDDARVRSSGAVSAGPGAGPGAAPASGPQAVFARRFHWRGVRPSAGRWASGPRRAHLNDPRPGALQFPQKPCENRVSSPHKGVGVAGQKFAEHDARTRSSDHVVVRIQYRWTVPAGVLGDPLVEGPVARRGGAWFACCDGREVEAGDPDAAIRAVLGATDPVRLQPARVAGLPNRQRGRRW